MADLFIPIYNYEPFHRPSGEGQGETDGNQIRREKLLNVLAQTLNTNLFAGVYLITGFRGSGKTSLLKRAIKEFKDKQRLLNPVLEPLSKIHLNRRFVRTIKQYLIIKKIAQFLIKVRNWLTSLLTLERHIVVESNLSGQRLTSFEVLKNLTWSVYSHYSYKKRVLKLLLILWYLLPLPIAYLLLVGLPTKFPNVIVYVIEHLPAYLQGILPTGSIGCLILLYFIGLALLELIALVLRIDPTQRKNLKRLRTLNQRISTNELPSYDLNLGAAALSIAKPGKRHYLHLTEKEVAFELKEIIDNAQSHMLFPVKFIFIIDELDKLEASQKGNSANEQIKIKKELIFTLLGELKHFFVSAKAKFYFISGSEMFDASLADTTERDAYLGSIFHKVIYVPSLLTDFNNHTSDISAQVELFVCQFLSRDYKSCNSLNEFFGNWRLHEKDYLKREYYLFDKKNYDCDKTNDETQDQRRVKHYYILKSFITYLTFRSKGSPKRMVSLFEEYLMTKREFQALHREAFEPTTNFDYEFYDGSSFYEPYSFDAEHVLVFDEADQYKFGLNSFLNSPFLYSFSTMIANYSDKQIISTLFLWDHVFKYHNAAFSRHHLEYIYEIISISKEPDIHKQLDFLLSLSKGRWLREIRSGLADFKFTSRLRNEIRFLSNTSQSEAAVYNFTLDESENLKGFYKALLNEADTLALKEKKDDPGDPSIRGFALRILGDLNYFDQEYDKANIYYELAVKPYLSMDGKSGTYTHHFSHNELVSVVRWMLHLSLTYEKNKRFNKAYTICNDINTLLLGISSESKKVYIDSLTFSKIIGQIALQKLMLKEKMYADGLKRNDIRNELRVIGRLLISNGAPLQRTVLDSLFKTETYHKIINIFFFRNTADNDSLVSDKNTHSDAKVARLYLHNTLILAREKINQNIRIRDLVLRSMNAVTYLKNDKNNVNYLVASADYLSKAGNALLTFYKKRNDVQDYLNDLKKSDEYTQDNYLSLAHRLWHEASVIFKDIASYGEAAEQRLKKLYLIREVIKVDENDTNKDWGLRQRIGNYCIDELNEILNLNHYQYDNSQRTYVANYLFIQKGSGFFAYAPNKEVLSVIQAAPNAPDAIEAIVACMEILLKINVNNLNPILEAYINSINEYSIVQSQYVRVMELHFKAKYNYRKFNSGMKHLDNMYDPTSITYNSIKIVKFKDGMSLFCDYCIDSIYCLLEVLRIINTQRNDFMIGHSFTGTVYKKLAWWGIVYRGLQQIEHTLLDDKGAYIRRLQQLIHKQNKKTALFPKYNFEKAIGHYQLAKQTHQRGTPYTEMIHQLFALEDDLNDEFTHFMLALDRMRYVNGEFEVEIKGIEDHLKLLIKDDNSNRTPIFDSKNDWLFDLTWLKSPGMKNRI